MLRKSYLFSNLLETRVGFQLFDCQQLVLLLGPRSFMRLGTKLTQKYSTVTTLQSADFDNFFVFAVLTRNLHFIENKLQAVISPRVLKLESIDVYSRFQLILHRQMLLRCEAQNVYHDFTSKFVNKMLYSNRYLCYTLLVIIHFLKTSIL